MTESVGRSASFGGVKAGLTNRKLKDMTATFNTATTIGDSNCCNLEDYPGYDPSPSSKVDVHAGPIENGSPLMPYFIGPNPPPHRGQGLFGERLLHAESGWENRLNSVIRTVLPFGLRTMSSEIQHPSHGKSPKRGSLVSDHIYLNR
ncbi:hypothetical protein IEQ34_007222 [Dendrobium chrysotoxum]|uniref:Uncharacterized protein n=1 Tax=Dendrobium chrysotoxum TaxID=161865 RepID=A0AAV7H776_DENCH|nr:hypothetical protein IEQ34_007222 [Dendrobium chrysotoxum]